MRYITCILIVATLVLVAVLPVPIRASTTPTDVFLVGPGGSGGTTVIASILTGSKTLGTQNSLDSWQAQSFKPTYSGLLSQIIIRFGANTGSPSGTATWEIHDDDQSLPSSTVLETGTFTPTASASNTITAASTTFLLATTRYWLVLKSTAAQTNGVFWTINFDSTNTYASGQQAATTTAGSTWNVNTSHDLSVSVVTVPGAPPASLINYKLAQSYSVGGAQTVSSVSLYLKKSGTPTDTMTLRIEYDGGDYPSGILISSDATADVAESSLTTSYALVAFTFAHPVPLTANQKYWLVLSTTRVATTNYVAWGADETCGIGDLKHYTSFWAADEMLAIYSLNAYIPTATPTSTSTRTPTPTTTYTPSPTYTPTPNTHMVGTLSSGQAYSIDTSMNAGDIANNMLLVVIVGLLMFCIAVWLIRR